MNLKGKLFNQIPKLYNMRVKKWFVYAFQSNIIRKRQNVI